MTPYTFTHLLCLLVFVQWLFLVEGSHFRHAVMSFVPTDADNNTLRFTFRLALRRSYYSYYCDENTINLGGIIGSGGSWTAKCSDPFSAVCSPSYYIADTRFRCTDFSRNEDWSMGENNFTYTFPSGNLEWNVRYQSCCWISNLVRYADSQWSVSTKISLSRRSDSGKINSSPVSKSPAIARFQQGCHKSLTIPVEDPDGDFVKCRWATSAESSIPSDSFPYGELDEKNCILTYRGGLGASGTYVVTLTLEDFPAGTTNFNNIRPFSAVPLQFLVIIGVGFGSCQDIPVFTSSTPKNGECSEIQIGSVYKAVIEVRLPNVSKHIVEITTSSPLGMQLTPLSFHGGIFFRNVTWYPSQNQIGQQLFCFQALDSDGLQSEWRCVTILVGLSNTPHVILGTRRPISPISEIGTGLIWWSIHFNRVIKKPRSPAFIRLVLQSNGFTVFKVNALSGYVVIDSNRTVLHFATPKAALSMNSSYAILIDPGAVVGQGCSNDGPPTPGITSPMDWTFPVDGVCPLGYALVSPSFQKCEDIDECGGHHRSKRSYWWYNVFSQNSACNATGEFINSTSGHISSYNFPGNYDPNRICTWNITVPRGKIIKLTFLNFTLVAGENDDCAGAAGDSARVFITNVASHGGKPNDFKICGQKLPPPVYSEGNFIQVRFESRTGLVNKGFNATFEAIDRDSLCPTDMILNETSGSFSSPFYPRNYPFNQTCSWKIIGKQGYRVELTIPDYNLQRCGGAGCLCDYMEVQNSFSAEVLPGKLCGTPRYIPVKFYSLHESLRVVFVSDDTIMDYDGFGATYKLLNYSPPSNKPTSSATNISPSPATSISSTASAMLSALPGSCLYNLGGQYGYFNSPNYPFNYDHHLNCVWIITVPNGYYIYLRFDHFHLQGGHGSCPFDYVQIYDGLFFQSLTIRRCYYQNSWCVYSHSNVLYVYFVTDHSVSYSGFTAYYERVHQTYHVCPHPSATHQLPSSVFTGISPTPASILPMSTAMLPAASGSCLYNLYGPQGNFSTPNYPQNYGHNVHCTWLITTSPGSYIFLRFDHFHLEGNHGSCPYDYVRIYDGNSYQSLTMRRCDYQDSWCIYSHSNVLYVHFQTDGSVSYPGFTAFYEKVSKRYAVCKVNSSISQGITPTSAAPWASASAVPSFASECYYHSYLTEAGRRMSYYNGFNGYLQCDNLLPFGWYRFGGAAGTEMPTSCVGKNRCGTHAPGWLNGSHPRATDGIVRAKVCFHWSYDCCLWSANIRVRNCSGFYVYELVPPPNCHLRYCGNGGALHSTSITPTPSQSTAAVTPAIPGNCFHHLNHPYGLFESPGKPSCYPNNKYCAWLLEAPVGQYIDLQFYSFHLEYGASYCPWDYVEVLDGNSLHSPILVKACGQLAWWRLYSSGRFLMVLFKSDSIIGMPGFSAYYRASYNRYNISLPSQVSITSPVQCSPTQTQTTTPVTSNVHGIQPTPASAMTSTFYAASSVNVQPNPSQFQFHLPAQCEQSCHNTLGSYTCSCISGYQLAADGKSCLDVDECSISNGGCSHHCYNIPGSFYCGCPDGTSMGANNLTCVEPGVSVNCSDIITVALEKKTFPFFDVARLHLRYSSCKATQNDTHLLINTPLNGCGTLVNETEDDLIFWNEIRTEVILIDNVITRSHEVKIPFYCSYSRRKWVNLGFKPQHLHFGTEAGYGNFTFKIDFYKSSSFATPYTEQDYPLSVPVNQFLYVRYSVESSADLVIMAVTCRATKTGSLYSWPQYSIILNGCPRDTTMEYNFDPQRNYQQFKIRAFRFFNDYDQVYIHCEVLACHKYSSNSRCTQSCLGSKKRKRRDVTRDETEHEESTTKVTLTRGPLIFQQDEEPGDTGKNKQTALIGGVAGAGGFALIAVAALAVLFVKYRMARRFINRNKVGDLYTTQDEQLSRRNAYVQPEDMVEQEDSF